MLYAGVALALVVVFFASGVSMSESSGYDKFFQQYAPSGISWTVLKRICMIESSLGENPRVKIGIQNPSDIKGSVSYDGLSWGVMQMRITTAKDFDPAATEEKLNDPEYSIRLAGLYLNWARNYILKNTSIDQSDARLTEFLVKSYNQGVGATVNEINYSSKSYAQNYWSKFNNADV